YYTARARASTALGFSDTLGSTMRGPASPELQASTRKLQAIVDRYLGLLRKDLAKRYGARVPVLLDAHWSDFWFYYVNRPAPAFRIRATDAGLRVARSLTDDLLSRYAAFAIETEPEALRVHRELMLRVAAGEDPSTVGDEVGKRIQPLVDAALRRHGLVVDQIAGLQEVTAAYYEELHDRRKGHGLSEVERSFVGAYGEATLALLKKHWTEFQPYYEAMDRDARGTMDATRAAIRAAPVAP
ncbi:MAG TPA: hypothetical protein VMB50_12965, partial [Myxococcales bacterium]|nr:hypothetical protein [Myxococcales bacterium]